MFIEASERDAAASAQSQNDLYDRLEILEKTASTWFDATFATVAMRRDELLRTARLCQRVAGLPGTDEDDIEDVLAVGNQLTAQAKRLAQLANELHAQEQQDSVSNSAPVFSSKGLQDESRTASHRSTDWDLYLAVEPRNFVAANRGIPAEEMRIRAFNFIDVETSGHGLSRKAKMGLAQDFLAEVEREHSRKSQKTAAVAAPQPIHDDSALFF